MYQYVLINCDNSIKNQKKKKKSNKRNPLLQIGNLDDNDDLLIKTMVSW